MIKTMSCLLALGCCLLSNAQQRLHELTIGDHVPDITLDNVLNHPGGKIRLSELNGKLVILDLMRTNCSSCIKAFPRFEQMQKQFAGKVQFIIVLNEDKEKWTALTKKNKLARELTLPVVLSDTVLSSMFPYVYTPHEVWIDAAAKVKAITAGEYIKPANIQAILDGDTIEWALKKDVGNYTFENHLLQLNEQDYYGHPLYYSAITGHRSGTNPASRFETDSINKLKKYAIINAPLPVLFRYTMTDSAKAGFSNNRYVVEMQEPHKFIFDPSQVTKYQWTIANTYCYEAILPLNTSDEDFRKKLKQDLENFMGLSGHFTKRRIECYILTLDKPANSFTPPATKHPAYKTTGGLVEVLNMIYPTPFVDETRLSQPVNLPDLGPGIYDIEKVKNFLQRYGFQISTGCREIEVFVVKEE